MTTVATRYNPMSQSSQSFPRTVGGTPASTQWEAIFGPMPNKPEPSPYSSYPVEHSTLPKAYEGQNVYLAEKISGLVNTTGDFWTGKLLPWQQSDHIGPFKWSEWIFNQTLASRVPHEGVPRLISTSEKHYQATPVRRGLAAEFEADFASHPRGQIIMARKIQGMVVSIQTTINLDVQTAILMSQDEKKTRSLQHSVTRVPISEQITTEITSWNAVSKNPRAFMKLAMRAKRLLLNQGAQPPLTLLVTPETTVHMREENMPPRQNELIALTTDEQKMANNLLANAQEFPRLRDGTEVIEIRDMKVEETAMPDQLFTTQSIIGEFFVIDWSPHKNANLYNGCMSPTGKYRYCSDQRTILVHDMDLDVLTKITIEDCIINGGRKSFPDMDILSGILSGHKDNYGNRNWFGHENDHHFYPDVDDKSKTHNDKHGNKRTAHMMFYKERGQPRIVHHVGTFDENVTPHKTQRQMGQTLLSLVELTETDIQAASDFGGLMEELENAPYEPEQTQMIMKMNPERERLDEDYAKRWGLDETTRRMVGKGPRGGLKIPGPGMVSKTPIEQIFESQGEEGESQGQGEEEKKEKEEGLGQQKTFDTVPSGLASFAGLLGLSALGRSDYSGLAGRAKDVVNLVTKLYNAWKNVIHSEFMDPRNRMPQDPADGIFTFFNNVIYMARESVLDADDDYTLRVRTPGNTTDAKAIWAKYEPHTTYSKGGKGKGKSKSYQSKGSQDITVVKGSPYMSGGSQYASRKRQTIDDIKKSIYHDLAKFSNDNLSDAKLKFYYYISAGAFFYLKNKGKEGASNITKYILPDKYKDDFDDMDKETLISNLFKRIYDNDFDDVMDLREYLIDSYFSDPFFGSSIPKEFAKLLEKEDDLTRLYEQIQEKYDEYLEKLAQDSQESQSFGSEGSSFYTPHTYAKSLMNRGNEHTSLGFLARHMASNILGTNTKGSSLKKTPSYSSSSLFSSSHFDDDDLFEDSVIESIADAARRGARSEFIGAREGGERQYPIPMKDADIYRSAPYSSMQTADAFRIVKDKKGTLDLNTATMSENKTSAGLLFEFDTDNMKASVIAASRIASTLERWATLAIVSSRVDETDHWLNMIHADVLVPCNVLLQRGRQVFLADSYVLMQPGSDTGGTLFSHASSMISIDGITRRYNLNFVFYSKAIVWNPDNIYIMKHAKVNQYLYGSGTRFIRNLEDLLNAGHSGHGDLISLIVPVTESRYGSHIRTLGHMQNDIRDRNMRIDPYPIGSSFSSAEYLHHWMTDPQSTDSYKDILDRSQGLHERFLEAQDHLPRLLFQGHQQNYNPASGQFDVVVLCRGHKGHNGSYPGSMDIYNGNVDDYLSANPNYEHIRAAY